MKKHELILLVGPPASGKTTWARDYINTHDNTLIVSRDKLREMLFGYSEATIFTHYMHEEYDSREGQVTLLQQSIVRTALNEGKSVIIDDTNLDSKGLRKWVNDYSRYDIRVEVIHTSRLDCTTRNAARTRVVASEAINAYYDRYLDLCRKGIQTFYPATPVKQYVPDETLPSAYLIDLDGTIANLDHRKPYGCSDEELLADRPIMPVVELVLQLMYQDKQIVFLTGREDKQYGVTSAWLAQVAGSMNWHLYMRKTKDFRKDSLIKQELFWSEIAPKFQIKAIFDDRKQVKQMWVDMGLFVFDVNQRDLWF